MAFAFEAPRDSVPIITTASPANSRASGGGAVEVDERGDAAAVAHDRKSALAYRLDQPIVGYAVGAAFAVFEGETDP